MDYSDLSEEEHADLLNHCEALWDEVVIPAAAQKNNVNYHSCCHAFTTRTMTEKSEHTERETGAEFFRKNNIKDGKTLYLWYIKDMHSRIKSGLPTYELTLNTKHHEPDKPVDYIKTTNLEVEYWKKRMEFKEDKLLKAELKVDQLEQSIQKLTKERNKVLGQSG